MKAYLSIIVLLAAFAAFSYVALLAVMEPLMKALAG